MIVDIDVIKGHILPEIVESGVAAAGEEVIVEADQDEFGSDFLRVQIKLQTGRDVSDQELEALLEAIEDVVDKVDDRYVSVRFDEAA